MKLPVGWYPRSAEEIDGYLHSFAAERCGGAKAVIAPHAGWFFSGKIAGRALSSLRHDADLVVIAGGHLPPGHPVLFAEEDAACTPFGELPIDRELRALVKDQFLRAGFSCGADNYTDNTVEVLLPAIHRFLPGASILWLRLGADIRAVEAGALIYRAATAFGRRAVIAGSTDLTHYGPDYGFCPKGRGKTALDWVKTVNDRRFIEAVLSGDAAAVIKRAGSEHSACSAGAVLCAMGFAAETRASVPVAPTGGENGPEAARLLDYTTSADVRDGYGDAADSFVGYAAIELA
jgi:AmmeMemoRadiSam system protein B